LGKKDIIQKKKFEYKRKNEKKTIQSEIKRINKIKKFAEIFNKIVMQLEESKKIKNSIKFNNFYEKKKKDNLNALLKNSNIKLNSEKKNLNSSSIDIDALFQKRIKKNNVNEDKTKEKEVDPGLKLLEDVRNIVYGTKVEKKEIIKPNKINKKSFLFFKEKTKKIKKTPEEKIKIKKALKNFSKFLFEKKNGKLKNLYFFKLLLKKLKKNKSFKKTHLFKSKIKFNKNFNKNFLIKQEKKIYNKKQSMFLYKNYFNKLKNKSELLPIKLKYKNGKVKKIEVYSEKFKKVMRVIPKYKSLLANQFKTWNSFFWFKSFSRRVWDKRTPFILNLAAANNSWFLNFDFFILDSGYQLIYRYFNLFNDNFLFVNNVSLQPQKYNKFLNFEKKKSKIKFFKSIKLKNSFFIEKRRSKINLKKKWILNYKIKNFFTPVSFNLLKKKKKVKTFKIFNFNFFLKFGINFRWSNTFKYYRKNKFKKSLDIRFLYLKLWEVIKQKKFKLHLPFLFLSPNFVNKTFLSVKFLFLKFFKLKNLIFSKRIFTFKYDLINRDDNLKKKMIIFKIFFLKSFFMYKTFRILKKNLAKAKINKIIYYNSNFVINSYWSFLKIIPKKNFYNHMGLISLNLLNLGLLNFQKNNDFLKI